MELAAFFVERSLARESSNVVIRHDVRLRDRRTKAFRQFDVVVQYEIAGQTFLRIVEVQDRNKRVGADFVGQIADKVRRVLAHRATIVSVGGFTSAALNRILDEGDLLDAIRLRELDSREVGQLPELLRSMQSVQLTDDTRGVSLGSAAFSHWSYERPDSGDFIRHIALCDASVVGARALLCIVIEPSDDAATANLSAYLLGQDGQRRITRFGMELESTDGSRRRVTLQRPVATRKPDAPPVPPPPLPSRDRLVG